MGKEEFKQGVTFKIFTHHRRNADQTNSLFLRVTIDRVKKEFNLNKQWPAEFFSSDKQEALPRHPKDVDVSEVNMVIKEARGRADRIALLYFSQSRTLTHELFKKEFLNYANRDNFVAYWEEKIEYQKNEGFIDPDTAKNHTTNLNRFKAFLGDGAQIPMNEINVDLILKYRAWLKKRKVFGSTDKNAKTLSHNSIATALKVLKTYTLLAIDDKYLYVNPFDNKKTSIKFIDGERLPLEIEEIQALNNQLYEEKLSDDDKEILRKFLFSCYTGLRISDSNQIRSGMIKGNVLTFTIRKGRNRKPKELSIPLPKPAVDLIEGRKGVLFKSFADQTCNIALKRIALAADIDKNLTFHVSRDTFGTLFTELTNDIATLKELMGHEDVRTTMIYVKISEKRKEKGMSKFNDLDITKKPD